MVLGLVLGGLLAAGALALTWPEPAAPSEERPYDGTHDSAAMDADERCAHMPEHCTEGAPSRTPP